MNRSNPVVATVIGIGVIIVFLPVAIAIYGSLLALFWNWLLVPIFAVWSLGTVEALAVSLVVCFAMSPLHSRPVYRDEKDNDLHHLAKLLVAYILTLVYGYVLKSLLGV